MSQAVSTSGSLLSVIVNPGSGSPAECGVTYIESLDLDNPAVLRELDSGSYVLYGKFKAYSGDNTIIVFESKLNANIVKSTDCSSIMIFNPVNSKVECLTIYDDRYERTDVALQDVVAHIGQLKGDLANKQDRYILSTNRLDFSKVTANKQLNTLTGETYDADGYYITDYCDISTQNESGYVTLASYYDANTSYSAGYNRICFYDDKKLFISGINFPTIEPIFIPQGARYVRCSTNGSAEKTAYVNVGTVKAFSEYYVKEIIDIFEETKEETKKVAEATEETKKFAEETSVKISNILSQKVVGAEYNKIINVTSAFNIDGATVFEVGKKYVFNIKDEGTNHFSRFTLYVKLKDESYTAIYDATDNYVDGIDIEVTIPDNFKHIMMRTYTVGSCISWVARTDCINPSFIDALRNPLNGKTLAFYGDSITAQNNGDFINNSYGNTWAGFFAKNVGAKSYYGRGVGGQTYRWNNGCWYTEVGTNGQYKERYKYDSNGNIVYSSVDTSTTQEEIALIESALGCEIEIHRGCYCSWDRITTMFPSDIKDLIDVLFIMGGTNDFLSVEEVEGGGEGGTTKPVFSSSNTTDTDWVNSPLYLGGDYDVSKTWGGMASTIMKFKTWMPNCKIVILTPIERVGSEYNHYTNDYDLTTFALSEKVISVAHWCNTEVWNMFAECGIDVFNASVMLADEVHPNQATGGMRMAEYLTGKSVSMNLFK